LVVCEIRRIERSREFNQQIPSVVIVADCLNVAHNVGVENAASIQVSVSHDYLLFANKDTDEVHGFLNFIGFYQLFGLKKTNPSSIESNTSPKFRFRRIEF
jgi:hypothetical protein